MVRKARMSGEVVILAMFEDEDSAFCEEIVLEYEVGKSAKVFEGVGWVGKYEVELLPLRARNIFENIGVEWMPCRIAEFAADAL